MARRWPWQRSRPASAPAEESGSARPEPVPAPATAPAPPPAAGSDIEALRALAAAHLPPDVAATWLAHLRPAVRLQRAVAGDQVIARLGGTPVVPEGFEWPVWEGHGPLAFVGEVDLTALHAAGLPLDVALPSSGRLLAFYFDGSYDDFAGIVGTWDPETLAGARLVHVPEARDACAAATTPPRVQEFGEQALTGRSIATFAGWEHPALKRLFGAEDLAHREWMAHPVNGEEFTQALWDLRAGQPLHQIGGYADPQQGPVEAEVAHAAPDQAFTFGATDQPGRMDDVLAWSLLLQIDTDDASDMMWGDVGTLYWLSRPGADDPLATVSFTWQCG